MNKRPICETPGCGRTIPKGGEGHPEMCPVCLEVERRVLAERKRDEPNEPIPMRLPCPECGELHFDEDEFATKIHHTHACQNCGHVWRPAIVATVGVRFLPGFKDGPPWCHIPGCSVIGHHTKHADQEGLPIRYK
jgi:hypothetical protein